MLVNGRRLPSSGNVDGGFANLNTIPQGAVERIDVLPQGASAIYGSDALAGVVNVILRKDVDMAMLDTKYGYADGIDDRTVSGGWGKTWNRGSVLLMGEYYDRTSLSKDQRDITRNVDFTRYGYRDLRTTTCNPGTIYAVGSGNLPGLGANSAAIPAGLDGVPSIADLAGGAGQINRCGSIDNLTQLIFPAHRYSFVGTGDFKLTDDITLFSELWYSRLHHEFASVVALSKVAVPASNPFNPFGTTVRLDYRFDNSWLGDPTSDVDEKMRRAVLGARGTAFGDWQWEVSGAAARDNSWTVFMIPNSAFVPPELASTDPQTAFDPFTSGAPVAPDVLRSYVSSGLISAIPRQAIITTTGGNLVMRGSLFDLPAGTVSAAFGGEYGHERFENSGQRGPFDVSRNNKAAFAEVRVPVLARSSGTAARDELLTVTAAVRRDDYSDFGNATTPQYGLEIHPVANVLLRASYSEAFRAPDLYAVYGPLSTGVGITVTDPRRNGELTPGLYYQAGGNPNLQPETGRSVSAGVVWSSVRWEGLRAAVNWWKVAMSNRISLFPAPQLIVNNEGLFPERVTRAAPSGDGLPGAITGIDYSALNLGNIWVDGVDLDLSQRVRTPFGTLLPSVRVSRNTKYDALLNPALGISDYLGNANTDIWVPKLRGTVGLGFERAAWSASLDGRYVGHYRDYNPLLSTGLYQRLGNTWTWDVNMRWELGENLRLRGSWLSKLHVALGAVNVFDRQPQFSASTGPGYGFDAGQYDIRGRYAYAQLGVQF
jgi:iron complex outermembrane receptor protein